MAELEASAGGNDRGGWRTHRRRARQSGRAALGAASRCASRRTETFRLAGVFQWLNGDPAKACSWWRQSIETGRRLGAQPELGRTYAEVGRRLGAEATRTRELEGMDAAACRHKARKIFEKLGLERDLDQLAQEI